MSQLDPSSPAQVPAARVERLREFMQQSVEAGYFAGVTSCVVQGGRELQNDAYGFRDLESEAPMRTDTICRIASSTKPIIAAAMMALHEEGRWRLDDLVSQHIPDFADMKVRLKDGSLVEPVQPMRMRHLMCHGIGFNLPRPVADAGGDRSRRESQRVLRPRAGRIAANLPELIERVASQPLSFHPGKRFLYGLCCDVQGYVIEKLSGQGLDRFLLERIFAPLGMNDTGFWVEPDKCDRVASLYQYQAGQLSLVNKPDPERIARRPGYLSGGGGLWSTPDDYQRFCQMLLDEGAAPGGARVLSAASVRAMRQDLLEPQVYVQVVPGYRIPGARFGMNVQVLAQPQGDNAMYGRDSYSWGGAFGTYFWVDPQNALFASGMMQIVDGGAQHLGAEVEYPDLKRASAQLLYWGQTDERAVPRAKSAG